MLTMIPQSSTLNITPRGPPPPDPVEGDWCMDGNEMGMALEANEGIIKNACWLHPTDTWNINLAKLDAALKGHNWPFNGKQQCCIWSLNQHVCMSGYPTP